MRRAELLVFICSASSVSSTFTGSGTCPSSEWFSVDGRCYKMFGYPSDWYDSMKGCISHGAMLATFHTPMEEEFLERIANQMPNMHIGLRRFRGDDQGAWYWVDELTTPANTEPATFTKLKNPEATDPLDSCGSSGPSPSTNGNAVTLEWADCDEKRAYLCSTIPHFADEIEGKAEGLWKLHEESGDFVRMRGLMHYLGLPIPTQEGPTTPVPSTIPTTTLPTTPAPPTTTPMVTESPTTELVTTERPTTEAPTTSTSTTVVTIPPTTKEEINVVIVPTIAPTLPPVDLENTVLRALITGPSAQPGHKVQPHAEVEVRQKFTILFVGVAVAVLLISIATAGLIVSRRKPKSAPPAPDAPTEAIPEIYVYAAVYNII